MTNVISFKAYCKQYGRFSNASVCLPRQLQIRHIAARPASYERRCLSFAENRRSIACSSILSPDVIFNCTTMAAIPIYSALIAFPHMQQITTLLKSRLLLFAASLVYAVTCINVYVSSASQPTGNALAKAFTSRRIEWLANLLHCKKLTCLAWTHLLLLDLFQARFVYIDGQRHGIPTRHSLVLCFMFGPIGLLSHMTTKLLVSRRRSSGHLEPS